MRFFGKYKNNSGVFSYVLCLSTKTKTNIYFKPSLSQNKKLGLFKHSHSSYVMVKPSPLSQMIRTPPPFTKNQNLHSFPGGGVGGGCMMYVFKTFLSMVAKKSIDPIAKGGEDSIWASLERKPRCDYEE